jgi:uncharacterized membrane protein YdjX (TVP38/TMEM64 family)
MRLVVPVAVVAGLLAAATQFPVERWALALVDWIRGAGAPGVVLFAIVYVAAAVLLLPGWILTAGAGFAYGPAWGLLLVSPVSVLAATAAFTVGRSVARGWVSRKVSGDPRFAAIDEAVGHSGFRIVLLLRLSPVFPFNLLNYVLGLTRVRLRDYVLASLLGMLPGTFLYVYLGSLVTSASEIAAGRRGPGGELKLALYAVGIVATLAVTVVVARIARRALARALHARSAETAAGEAHP